MTFAFGPWTRRELIAVAALTVLGTASCIGGWITASGHAQLDHQLRPAALSILGVALVFGGQAAWFISGRRAVGRRTLTLLGSADVVTIAAARPLAGRLVAGPRLSLFHRADCQLVTGNRWRAATRSNHLRAGRRPCGVCEP